MKTTKQQRDLKEKQSKDKLMLDLKFNTLRLKVVTYAQKLLIHQLVDVKSIEFQHILNVMGVNDLQEIAEERVSQRRCCNLQCAEILIEEHVKKVVSRKFNIMKGGQLKENVDPRVFCNKVMPNDKSECEDSYLKMIADNEKYSDGGPFNKSIEIVMEYLHSLGNEEVREVIDTDKIKGTLREFKEMRAEIGGPVVERKVIIPKKEEEESKAEANFKVKVVSKRIPVAQEVQAPIIDETNKTKEISAEKKTKKSVTFQEDPTQTHVDKADQDDYHDVEDEEDEEIEGDDSSTQSKPSEGSEGGDDALGYFDVGLLKKDLENYRQNEMSAFQKINHFFINHMNDNVYYYVKAKRLYSSDDMPEKSASRDFLLRQIQIQLDEVIIPQCKQILRKGEKESIYIELQRILCLMNIHSFSIALQKEDWKSLTLIFLKVCQLKFENTQPKFMDEWQTKASEFLKSEVRLTEEESVTLDLFNQ